MCDEVIVELTEENRIFRKYKERLIQDAYNGKIRFICIEYTCHFPKINPYKMANALKNEGLEIVFDNSAISPKGKFSEERKG